MVSAMQVGTKKGGGKQEAEKADFGTYESGMHEVAFCGEPLTSEKGHTGVCPS